MIGFKIEKAFKDLIIPLSEDEHDKLEKSIVNEGCRDPLVIWNGILIDGHNRYEICTRRNITYQTTEIELADKLAAQIWIRWNQLGRRNLTDDQRAMVTAQLAKDLAAASRKERARKAGKVGGKVAGVGRPKAIGSEATPSSEPKSDTDRALLVAAMITSTERVRKAASRRAKVSERKVKKAHKVMKQAPDLVQKVVVAEMTLTEAEREIKKREFNEKAKNAVETPSGKFRVFYADPSWKYNDTQEGIADQYGPAEKHYRTMSIPELAALPVVEMAEKDAVLFIWVTSPFLFESKEVFEAWGFHYKASFIWDKVKHNMGHYNSVRHEFLLICTRGSCTPEKMQLFDSVQCIERSNKHSEKPEEFRKIIDTIYPTGRRVEFFARIKAEGWEQAFSDEL